MSLFLYVSYLPVLINEYDVYQKMSNYKKLYPCCVVLGVKRNDL